MKTIIAVTFFGILTYAFAEKLIYGEGKCQKVRTVENFDEKRLFSGNWYLTHATPSPRVTKSSICRDYALTWSDDSKFGVTYSYNGDNGNHYNVECKGFRHENQSDQYHSDCYSTSDKGEKKYALVDMYFIATDYDKYALAYRCVTASGQFEDAVFLLHRDKNPSDDEIKNIVSPYGLDFGKLTSRKDATCKS